MNTLLVIMLAGAAIIAVAGQSEMISEGEAAELEGGDMVDPAVIMHYYQQPEHKPRHYRDPYYPIYRHDNRRERNQELKFLAYKLADLSDAISALAHKRNMKRSYYPGGERPYYHGGVEPYYRGGGNPISYAEKPHNGGQNSEWPVWLRKKDW